MIWCVWHVVAWGVLVAAFLLNQWNESIVCSPCFVSMICLLFISCDMLFLFAWWCRCFVNSLQSLSSSSFVRWCEAWFIERCCAYDARWYYHSTSCLLNLLDRSDPTWLDGNARAAPCAVSERFLITRWSHNRTTQLKWELSSDSYPLEFSWKHWSQRPCTIKCDGK